MQPAAVIPFMALRCLQHWHLAGVDVVILVRLAVVGLVQRLGESECLAG
jgi:hypothetical protein